MLLSIITLLAIASILLSNTKSVCADDYWPEAGSVDSKSAVVMEASTGTILYEKHSNKAYYPASITKIMTAMLAIEYGNLSDTITFSEGAVYNTEGSSILRDVGEELSLKDCLYALMLESANDCAYAIAEYIAGDIESFADMMNEKAEELGCTNTHFTNPHGLPDDDHYTCAKDMALIAQAAYENEVFRALCGTKEYILPKTNKHDELVMHNHHQMLYPLKTWAYLYDYCVGGKTGYTTVANNTLVTYAEKDGVTLICVVMNSITPAHYLDTTKLFDYYFENYKLINAAEYEEKTRKTVSSGTFEENESFLSIDENANIIIPKTVDISEITSETEMNDSGGEVVATIHYYYAGHEVGSADVLANETAIETYEFSSASAGTGLSARGNSEQTLELLFKAVLIIIIAAAVVVVVMLFVRKRGSAGSARTEKTIEDTLHKRRRRRR